MPLDHFNIPKLRDRYKIAFLFCLVLAIYLPGVNAGFFIYDDYKLVSSLKGTDITDALHLFHHAGGRYWRPLIMASFLLDVSLGANSSWMHLQNILLHAANTILVFYIVRLLLTQHKKHHEWSLIAAALFAVHPVNTEAVNWISGRTDLLATVFSLSGFYLFLLSIRDRNAIFSWVSAALILLGCMAKEVAYPMFPAMLLSLLIVKDWRFTPSSSLFSLANAARYGLPFLIGSFGYFCLRWLAFDRLDQGVGKIIQNSDVSNSSLFIEQVRTGVIALGFYIKKLFIPSPLNFAIDHVSFSYLYLGIFIILVSVLLIFKRSLTSALSLLILFCITPAILNAIFQIAWTPYAERYLYLPSALLCTSFCYCYESGTFSNKTRVISISLCFFCFLGLTAHRNLQWMHSEQVLADAVLQNPNNISLRINNAIVLANTLGPVSGRDELGQVLAIEPTNQMARRALAEISLVIKNAPDQARRDLDIFFTEGQEPDRESLSMMIQVNEKRLENAPAEAANIINHELFNSFRKYYELTGEPAQLFAAVAKATTIDQRESLRGLLENLKDNPSVVTADQSKVESILATFYSTN